MKKANQLKADNQQKIVMKFQVQDLKDKSLLSPHQVKSPKTDHAEIIKALFFKNSCKC